MLGAFRRNVAPAAGIPSAESREIAGHCRVGLLRARKRDLGVGADEDDGGSGGLGLLALVGEAPAAEKGVVGEELVVVVGRSGGEVELELEEQVEGELERVDSQFE